MRRLALLILLAAVLPSYIRKDAMGSYLGSIRSRLVDYRPDLSLGELRGNARNINIQAARHILSRRAPAGIVMMDFAGMNRTRGVYVGGDVLVQALIENN